MPEALAAADNDYILKEASRPRRAPKRARAAAKRRFSGLSPARMRRFGKYAVCALCVAAFAGIALNALSLQKTRHPAPLFAHSLAPAAIKDKAIAPVAPPPLAAPPVVERAPAVPADNAPAAKPAVADKTTGDKTTGKKATGLHAHQPGAEAQDETPHDGISQLLLGKMPASEAQDAPSPKDVLIVQRALVKLGFVLKADGVMGATTHQAIERYERDHGRPSHGEMTPAVLRRLSAAAGERAN